MTDILRLPADRQSPTDLRSENVSRRQQGQGLSELRAAAEEFESLFVEKLLQSARQAELGKGVLDSESQEVFKGLLDREFAGVTAKQNSLGIADALVAQFRAHIDSGGSGGD